MTPHELSAITALLTILEKIGTWLFGLLLFLIVFGPWALHFIFWRIDSRRNQSREEYEQERLQNVLEQYRIDISEIKRLYESNARLVTRSIKAFESLEKLYGESVSVISLNTQTQTHSVDAIENNRFCPAVREVAGR